MRGWQSNLPIRKGDPVFILIMEEREENEGTYDSAPGYRYTPIVLPISGEYNELSALLFLNIHFRPHHSDIQEDRTEQVKEYYKWLIKEL